MSTMIDQAKITIETLTAMYQQDELGVVEQIAMAQAMATIAQAEGLQRIADRLELLCDTGTGYAGEPIAVLRTVALN